MLQEESLSLLKKYNHQTSNNNTNLIMCLLVKLECLSDLYITKTYFHNNFLLVMLLLVVFLVMFSYLHNLKKTTKMLYYCLLLDILIQ